MGRLLRNRLVPDPLMTDAEYLYQKNRERDRAEGLGSEPRPAIGKVWVQENAIARIGALCFIRKREQHHEQVAERFKNHYELAFGAGNPGGDPSRIQVDTSKVAHDSGIVTKIDHASKIKQAEIRLGKEAFDRLVSCIILEIPLGSDLHWRTRTAMVDLVLSDLDRLASVWKLSTGSLHGTSGGLGLEPAA